MQESIEIYIRPSGDRVLLNLYVPRSMQAQFLDSLRRGAFAPDVPMNLEFTVLPQWVATNEGDHIEVQDPKLPHVRVALSAINVHYTD